jgi:hypothetical protein
MMGAVRLWAIVWVLASWALLICAFGRTDLSIAIGLIATAAALAVNILESAHRYRRNNAPRRHRHP